MHMIDTNIFIYFLKGSLPQVYELFKASDPSLFKVPAIVEAGLILRAEKSSQRPKNLFAVERLLLPFEIAPFDREAARHYAGIRAHLEKKGTLTGPNDLIVSATARSRSAILITNNVKEFARVPGLAVESWSELDL